MNKLNTYIILVSLIIFTSCGFKVENKSNLSNFGISELKIEGDRRINYKIKSGLSFKTAKNSETLLDLVIKSTKTKTIKEKNIKNEITKYKIDISVLVIFNKVGATSKKSFTIFRTSFIVVEPQKEKTIKNKKLK